MELNQLTKIKNDDLATISGGFAFLIPALKWTLIGIVAMPIIKNIWNANSASLKLNGTGEIKWEGEKKNLEKSINGLKTNIKMLEAKITHFIPPFYEF